MSSIWSDTKVQELLTRVTSLETKVAYLERELDRIRETASQVPQQATIPRRLNGKPS